MGGADQWLGLASSHDTVLDHEAKFRCEGELSLWHTGLPHNKVCRMGRTVKLQQTLKLFTSFLGRGLGQRWPYN